MRVVAACVRLGAVHAFAYRTEVVTALLSALAVVVLNASVWGAVMEGTASIGGLGAVQMSTYVIVAWVVMTTTSTRLEQNLGNRFRRGQIATDLVKPLDLQLYLQARDLGRGLAALLVTALPVLVLCSAVFPFTWPTSPVTWLLVAASLLLSLAVGGQLSFIVGVLAFRFKNITGLARLKMTVVALLSGAAIPLDAFPEIVRAVVVWLPFQALAHAPTSVFLERGGIELVAMQAVWGVLLLGLARLAWWWALDHLTVQGG